MEQRAEIPVTVIGQAAFEAITDTLGSNQEYTYRTFADFDFGTRDLTQCMFTGSPWRNLRAVSANFQRGDFDGMQVEGCTFTDCDFAFSDLRAINFSRCVFSRCRFDETLIDGCTFDACTIEACSYAVAVQRDCAFASCILKDYSLARSSFTLCRIERTLVDHVSLADCTLLFMIMRSCNLVDVTLNIESIGAIYGLTAANLQGMKFMHLGRDAEPSNTRQVVADLLALFEQHGWELEVAITEVNFRVSAPAYALSRYLEKLMRGMGTGRVLRKDELLFFTNVLEELHDESRLPLVVLLKLIELLTAAQTQEQKELARRQQLADTVATISARVQRLARSSIEQAIPKFLVHNLDKDEAVAIECIFEQKPGVRIHELLNDAVAAANLDPVVSPRLLLEKSGSYIEVVEASMVSVFALRAILFALNGSVVQLTELKARWKVLIDHRIPRHFQVLAKEGKQDVPIGLRMPLQRLIEFAANGRWLRSRDLDGLETENLLSLRLKDAEKKDEV